MSFNSVSGPPLLTNLFYPFPAPYLVPQSSQQPYQGQAQRQSNARPEWTQNEIRTLLNAAKKKTMLDWPKVSYLFPRHSQNDATDKLNDLYKSGISTVKEYREKERKAGALSKASISYAEETIIEHKASNFLKTELVDQKPIELEQNEPKTRDELLESIACFLIE
jgi:hypothetical protein